MHYERQINKVTDYIGRHLDEPLTLETLSQVACFSKYHFHRLFTAYTGMSLQQYIRLLRLKRAARQLVVEKELPILEIACNAGFESHEAFTRAFKQHCGQSPSEFRVSANWDNWEISLYCLPQQNGDMMKTVSIKNMPKRRLAVLEHRGSPATVSMSVNTLLDWAKSQTRAVPLRAGEAFGFAYDDPKTTAPESFRFDLGLTVPENLALSGIVKEKFLPAGRYAVVTHMGSRENIGTTVYALYREWLPNSGEELADLPCLFCYYNFDHEVAETELKTECCLLLKDQSVA